MCSALDFYKHYGTSFCFISLVTFRWHDKFAKLYILNKYFLNLNRTVVFMGKKMLRINLWRFYSNCEENKSLHASEWHKLQISLTANDKATTKCTCPVEMLKMPEKLSLLGNTLSNCTSQNISSFNSSSAGQSWNVLLVFILNVSTISQATWILH